VSQNAIDVVACKLEPEAIFAETAAKTTTPIKSFHVEVNARKGRRTAEHARSTCLGGKP
jgi:hypothetical protein